MTALVLRGDAGRLPLPDASVDLIVTSPPYFALRSYTDGGQHYAGQLGAEATPAEYIAALVACTREWVRVLKPSGSIFVNLGDKYSGAQAQSIGPRDENRAGDSARTWRQTDPRRTGIPNKSLMLLPERYRIAAVDDLGLIARAVLVWSKPNGLPESVTDRVRRSHEDWVHLTKAPRYFAAVNEIRTPHARIWGAGNGGTRPALAGGGHQYDGLDRSGPHALGALPGSVWEVATEPLRKVPGVDVDHFAAFPSEWPRRLILGWSPAGICTACREGRRPVSTGVRMLDGQPQDLPAWTAPDAPLRMPSGIGHGRFSTDRRITGYACACPDVTAPTRPAVVLDPFGGTGTTAHVADALGRTGITVDLSRDYCRLAAAPELADVRRRKVLGLDKADPVLAGQLDLLALGDPA